LEDHCIGINNYEAARQATQYLIDMGHTAIAHLTGNQQHHDAVDRRRGYEHAIKDARLKVMLVEGDYTESSGVLGVERLLSAPKTFTAIFAANDQMAMGARLALYRRGIRVPEDVSLIGFDNMLGSAYMTPPLTTVHQPGYEMGVAASNAILKALAGERPHIPDFPVELLIRESVAVRR
jgi:LacI family transcriptional regulator